ncbi:MAG: hypothetical protein FDZ75_09415, partial [Actinobacteria bacterium]
MSNWWLLAPEYAVLLAGIGALFIGRWTGRDRDSALLGAVMCVVAAGAVVAMPLGAAFGGMVSLDGPARFARLAVLAFTAVWLLWLSGRGVEDTRADEAAALALFSATGGMLMSSATELVTLFMAMELSTLPAYILVGYRRGDIRNLEGALKYFLMSMLTTLVALYGFSFLYGASGSTFYAGFDHLGQAGVIGVV